jgi:hypothetical protein
MITGMKNGIMVPRQRCSTGACKRAHVSVSEVGVASLRLTFVDGGMKGPFPRGPRPLVRHATHCWGPFFNLVLGLQELPGGRYPCATCRNAPPAPFSSFLAVWRVYRDVSLLKPCKWWGIYSNLSILHGACPRVFLKRRRTEHKITKSL